MFLEIIKNFVKTEHLLVKHKDIQIIIMIIETTDFHREGIEKNITQNVVVLIKISIKKDISKIKTGNFI